MKLKRITKRLAKELLDSILCRLSDFEAKLDYPPSGTASRYFLKKYLKWKNVTFEDPIWAWVGFRIMGVGSMKVGSGCSFGNYTLITNHGHLEIGDYFLASSHLIINSGTHDLVTLKSRGTNIILGSNLWIGTRVTIIEDTEVADGCVIGAGSVVRGTFKENSLIVGSPARVVRTLDRD